MEDVNSFFNSLRMQPEMSDELLNRVEPRIHKNNTLWRKSLEPVLKLVITLRHLAAGDKYPTLQFAFRVARNTISTFIPELCQAMVEEYKDEVIISCLLPQMNSGVLKQTSIRLRVVTVKSSFTLCFMCILFVL